MITETQNPVVGKDEIFQFSDGLDLFNSRNATYVWNIWKKKAGTWINITQKPPKMGKKVSFKFGEKVLGEEFKLQVFKATPKLFSEEFETKSVGEFFLVPTSSKVPKIDKVILFNQGAKDPNKASYRDTLTARAYCVAMFNNEVEFQLWEDDAAGPGHNASINKNNQLPQTFKGRVNENGTAEVKISLLSNASILKAIANKYMMSGDKDEGANHEYYVTASYAGKIQKASQVNVDVANPDHQAKPKDDSAKFPATNDSKTKSQPDPKGNIKDAYFVNDKNQKLTSALVDTHVKVQILSSNLIGKYIQYVVWEKDFGMHDEIFRSGKIKVPGDICNTGGFKITESHFQKGIDLPAGDPDSDKQNYFLEIIVLDSTAESKKFGLDDTAGQPMEVVRSAAMVKEVKKDIAPDNKCPRCEADITYEEIVQIFPRAANNEKLAKELIDEMNSIKLKYGIDTCLKKAHMVTQMGSETEFRTLKEEINNYSVKTLINLFGYFKRHPQEATTYHGNLHEIAVRAYGLRRVDKERDIVSCSVSSTKTCNDLGNESKEDGYTYIGRGLLQLTGKYQYTQINKSFQKAFPNKGNLISNPELLEQPKYAVMSGLSYWINNNLNDKAEKGSDGSHVDSITAIINKNLDESHYKRRRNFFTKAKSVFKIEECLNRKKEEQINNGVEVIFDEGTNTAIVSEKSINILKKIVKASNTPKVIITSTARTPLEQASIMHNQTLEKGVTAQKALYGPNGELVIDVYVHQKSLGKTKAEIIKKMEEKINELGPSKVSRHCGNQNVLNVFDVSSRRMQNSLAFLNEAQKHKGAGKEISTLLNETDRNCYHFEIPQ